MKIQALHEEPTVSSRTSVTQLFVTFLTDVKSWYGVTIFSIDKHPVVSKQMHALMLGFTLQVLFSCSGTSVQVELCASHVGCHRTPFLLSRLILMVWIIPQFNLLYARGFFRNLFFLVSNRHSVRRIILVRKRLSHIVFQQVLYTTVLQTSSLGFRLLFL